jgi:glycosyltransferase involved in cell wall biosynthesis
MHRIKETISLVMPAYNEEANIRRVISDGLKELRKLTNDFEIVVVNDASTDKTRAIVEDMIKKDKRIKLINKKINGGCGAALITAYKNAKKDLIFYVPSDNQIRVKEIHKYISKINDNDVVIGYNIIRKDNILRKIKSRLYHFGLALLYGLYFKQITSSPLYRNKVIKSMTIESRSPFLAAEILYKAKRAGFKIAQVGMEHSPRVGGRATGSSFKEMSRTIWDMIRFWPKFVILNK